MGCHPHPMSILLHQQKHKISNKKQLIRVAVMVTDPLHVVSRTDNRAIFTMGKHELTCTMCIGELMIGNDEDAFGDMVKHKLGAGTHHALYQTRKQNTLLPWKNSDLHRRVYCGTSAEVGHMQERVQCGEALQCSRQPQPCTQQ